MFKKLLFLIAAVTSAMAVAYFVRNRVVRGSGNVIARRRTVEPFTSINLRGAKGTVVVTQADQHSVEVEADDNLIDRVAAEVKDGRLSLRFESNMELILPSKPIAIRASTPELTALNVDGNDKVRLGALKTDQLELAINGVGKVEGGPITARLLRADINGIGQCELTGTVTDQEIDINGIGKYGALGIESQNTSVEVNGLGDVKVTARATLNVGLSGGAKVVYDGNPTVTKQVSGGGKVMSLAEAEAATHRAPVHAG